MPLTNYPTTPDPSVRQQRLPGALRLARCLAAGQVVLGGAVAVDLFRTAAAIHPHGDGDWSSISKTASAAGGVVALVAALAVGLPAILLRGGGSGPRIALLVSEGAVALPLAVLTPAAVGATGQPWTAPAVVAALVAALAVGVAATRPSARSWDTATPRR